MHCKFCKLFVQFQFRALRMLLLGINNLEQLGFGSAAGV